MRQADQLLQNAIPVMRALAAQTGCDCVLTAVYGDQILDVHREFGSPPLALAFGRGRRGHRFRAERRKSFWPRNRMSGYASFTMPTPKSRRGRGWGMTERSSGRHSVESANAAFISRTENWSTTAYAVAAPISPYGHEPAAAIAIVMF